MCVVDIDREGDLKKKASEYVKLCPIQPSPV